jgi:hypothetical protein
MIFGVHNHYNNNSEKLGHFRHPASLFSMGEMKVRVTDQGLTIFQLDRTLSLAGKIKVARALDAALKKEFGTGLGFATCSSSDCFREDDLAPYYESMKAINSSMATIYTTGRIGGKWIALPDNLAVDHVLPSSRDSTAAEIVKILGPSENDRHEPAEGWSAFEKQLEKILMQANNSALGPAVRHQPLPGMQP